MFYELVDNLYEKYKNMRKHVPDEYINKYNLDILEDDDYNQRISYLFSAFHCMIDHYCILINQAIDDNRILSVDSSNPLSFLVSDVYSFIESSIDQKVIITIDKRYHNLIYNSKSWLIKNTYSEIPSRFSKFDTFNSDKIFEGSLNPRFEDDALSPDYIGKGGYAIVTKFKLNEYGLCFAKKKLNPIGYLKEGERFTTEYNLMSSVSHNNLLKVYSYNDEEKSYLMEYIPYTLKNFIRERYEFLSRNTLIDLMIQVLEGLKYLHNKHIFHRDLSLTNILIDVKEFNNSEEYICKIADFGLAKDPRKPLTSTYSLKKGTIIDPCLRKWEDFKEINDIYSLAFILNYIYTANEYLCDSDNNFNVLIDKCTTSKLKNRFQSCDEIIDYINNNLK